MMVFFSALLPVANGPVEQLKMSADVGFAKSHPLRKLRLPSEPTWPVTLPKEACVSTVRGRLVY